MIFIVFAAIFHRGSRHFDQTMCHINGVDLKPNIFFIANLDYSSLL